MVIDEQLVTSLLAEQFPHWCTLPVRRVVPGGWDHRTFRIGDALLARLPSAAAYAPQGDVERFWLPRLAPALPLAVPELVAVGAPGCGYPHSWSIYSWLEGETADRGVHDEVQTARTLASFLRALHGCDSSGGPSPGTRNFGRGGSLARYDGDARQAIHRLAGSIDADAALRHWTAALASSWRAPPVWVHGDLWTTNLLVGDGRLSAVIDWGLMAVGDPACDLAFAWRGLGPGSRPAFRAALPMDNATWARARGWALWKLAITAAGMSGRASEAAAALAALRELVAEDPDV